MPGKMASSFGDMGHTGVKVSELISGCLTLRGRFLSSNILAFVSTSFFGHAKAQEEQNEQEVRWSSGLQP